MSSVMCDEIGEILEKPGEMNGEWRISDFMSLPEAVNKFHRSPRFFFSDACWSWSIYPNGHCDRKSEGWIGLYLHRLDSGPPKTMSCTCVYKNAEDVEVNVGICRKKMFSLKKDYAWGQDKFMDRSDLLKSRKSELAPSDTLTFSFTLRSEEQHSTQVCLFRGLWNLSLNLKNILAARKRTDVVLKLKDGQIPAHRMILESRSSVFNGMFGADMRETETGEVNIEDGNEEAMKVFLSYAYSGDPQGLSSENACEVYKVAHKYDLQDLRNICSEIMKDSLSVETVCDLIVLADLYEDKKLKECAKDIFAKNKTEVFKTEKWKALKRENPAVGCEVLECVFGGND